MKQKELSLALKGIVILCLLAGVVLCGIMVPELGLDAATSLPEYAWLFWPCLIFVFVTCVPVLIVLVLVWQMATRIGQDNSFCFENADSLRKICALSCVDMALYVLAAIVGFFLMSGLHPFLLLFLFAILCIGTAIAVVAAALSHIVQKGAEMKAEQDLTI